MKESMVVPPFLVAKLVRNTGLPVIRQEVRSGNRRADFVGYEVEEDGMLTPQVVVEVKKAPSLEAQRQLMNYAEAFQTPYALLATPNQMIWFDTNTFLQTEEPSFQSHGTFITNEKEINDIFHELFNTLRNATTVDQCWRTLIHSLIVRGYLHEHSDLESWFSIETDQDFNQLLTKALNHFESEALASTVELPDDVTQQIVVKLGNLSPTHPKYGVMIIDLIERNGISGQYMSPVSIRQLYSELVKQISHNTPSRAIDLTTGYGGISLALMEQNLIQELDAFELDVETAYYVNLLSHISKEKNLTVHHQDSLKVVTDRDYDFALLDPPLRKMKGNPSEYPSLKLAENRGQLFAVELFIEKGLQLLKPGGHLIVLVPEGFMFSNTIGTKTTRDLIKQESIIEAIIGLPPHTLKPYTSVKMNALVLRKKTGPQEKAEEIFLAKCEKIEQFNEVVEAFGKWRRGVDI